MRLREKRDSYQTDGPETKESWTFGKNGRLATSRAKSTQPGKLTAQWEKEEPSRKNNEIR